MADETIKYLERMTGAGHPTLPDTLNRLTLTEHTSGGSHRPENVYPTLVTTGAISGNSLTIKEGLSIGNDTRTIDGTIRWHGANFQGYSGSGWISFLDLAWVDDSPNIRLATSSNTVSIGSDSAPVSGGKMWINGNVGINVRGPDAALDVGGTIMLTEQLSGNSSVATKGQLWVKTATPNELWFRDDEGNEFPLAPGYSGSIIAVTIASSGQVITAATAPALPETTIPQNTEGYEFMTVTHTPADATNILEVV